MKGKTNWHRVSKEHKCKVCDHADWCTFTDGASCCMRVESQKTMNNGGWLHLAGDDAPRYIPPPPRPVSNPIDAQAIWERWSKATSSQLVIGLGEQLGVDPMALHLLGAAWTDLHHAWAFPMKDAHGKVIGIRLRAENGRKWAVTGSKAGIFIPSTQSQRRVLMILEGPSDTAAALSLGYHCIGRAACLGQEDMVLAYIRKNRFQHVILVADNDGPGMAGASQLQNRLAVPSCIVVPPCKDMRDFVKQGGTAKIFESILKNIVWQQPKESC